MLTVWRVINAITFTYILNLHSKLAVLVGMRLVPNDEFIWDLVVIWHVYNLPISLMLSIIVVVESIKLEIVTSNVPSSVVKKVKK